MPNPPRPLIVRLRNWVGDVTLGVPALQRLADAGYALQLVGRGWARDLLAGHGWHVHVQPKPMRERVAQLRALAHEARTRDPGFDRRLNAVCFPYSLSSALEMRLAGLRAIGHAQEGRSLLLARRLPRPRGVHELQVYWDLASALLGEAAPLPATIGLRVAPGAAESAAALRREHGIAPGYVVICPFAGGTWAGGDKTWPAFPEFAAEDLAALGRDVLVCPGPGEEGVARDRFPRAVRLEGVRLGVYAALLRDAALMVSNDTGPGHLAAAVGTPLVSVLGPSDPALWHAWGPRVTLLGGAGSWPSRDEVRAAVVGALRAG
ncbi:MAG: heptosyltransferase [Rubrivivax sp.]|jgi:heptosyltransferase-2|nr:heptosyltransferase [Rubrivivax sp.]